MTTGSTLFQVDFTQSIKRDCTLFQVELVTVLKLQIFKLVLVQYHNRCHIFQVGLKQSDKNDCILFQVELDTVLLKIAHNFKLV